MSDFELTGVSFSENNPEVHFGQVRDILLCADGYPLADTDEATLLARVDNSSADPAAIRRLSVIGQKLAPNQSDVDLSHSRKTKTKKQHKITGFVDETNDSNYNFLVTKSETPNVQLRVWYVTDGHVYGGRYGVFASVNINHIIPQNDKEIEKFEFEIAWTGADPTRIGNPLTYSGDNDSEPSGTIEVFKPDKAYKSGSVYVSFSNSESADAQFRAERLFRCVNGTLVGETPETHPAKWMPVGGAGGAEVVTFFHGLGDYVEGENSLKTVKIYTNGKTLETRIAYDVNGNVSMIESKDTQLEEAKRSTYGENPLIPETMEVIEYDLFSFLIVVE